MFNIYKIMGELRLQRTLKKRNEDEEEDGEKGEKRKWVFFFKKVTLWWSRMNIRIGLGLSLSGEKIIIYPTNGFCNVE